MEDRLTISGRQRNERIESIRAENLQKIEDVFHKTQKLNKQRDLNSMRRNNFTNKFSKTLSLNKDLFDSSIK